MVIHSFMSGKKSAFLDGQQIHTSTSMKAAFSFSTHIGDSMVSVGASEQEPHYLRIDGVYFRDLPFYAPKGSSEYMSAAQKDEDQAKEHSHAQQAMNHLDRDMELAMKLQSDEEGERNSFDMRHDEDERMARRLQEEYDREHDSHKEYLKKAGVTVTRVEVPAAAPVGDLLSFDAPSTALASIDLLAPARTSQAVEEASFETSAGLRWEDGDGGDGGAAAWQDFGDSSPALVPAKKGRVPSGMKPPNNTPPFGGLSAPTPAPAPVPIGGVSAAFSDMDNMFLQEASKQQERLDSNPFDDGLTLTVVKGPSISFDDIDPLANIPKAEVPRKNSTVSSNYMSMNASPSKEGAGGAMGGTGLMGGSSPPPLPPFMAQMAQVSVTTKQTPTKEANPFDQF